MFSVFFDEEVLNSHLPFEKTLPGSLEGIVFSAASATGALVFDELWYLKLLLILYIVSNLDLWHL
jgi:hypothetical protein